VRLARRALLVALAGAVVSAGCTLPGRVEGPIELTAVFDDVGDLVSGHSVQVADVRVGSITGIELTDDYQARVTMRIKDDLALPADAEAVLRTTSLLGEKFVELRPPEGGGRGTLEDGAEIGRTSAAPELEFVAEQAVNVLASVAANDLATLIETGALAFGGRQAELGRLLEDLGTISNTLANQTGDIVAIIDGLDRATTSLAAGSDDLDGLLVNLASTTTLLAENRQNAVDALHQLTRLAEVQNTEVLDPYLSEVSEQIKQLDAVVDLVHARRNEVGVLVDWLEQFTIKIPLGIPEPEACAPRDRETQGCVSFAQIFGWLLPAPLEPAP
jgi:phospholipid/cholesterol/gamma-HCH transport system substrate-binding protein